MATQHSRSAARLMMAPAVILLLGWMLVPLAMTLYFSFQRLPAAARRRPRLGRLRQLRALRHLDPPSGPAIADTLIIVGGVLVDHRGAAASCSRMLLDQPMWGQGDRAHPRHRALLRHADRLGAGLEEHVHGPGERAVRASVARLFGAEPVEWLSQAPLCLDHPDLSLAMAALRDADPADRDPVAGQRTARGGRDGRRAAAVAVLATSSCRTWRARSPS